MPVESPAVNVCEPGVLGTLEGEPAECVRQVRTGLSGDAFRKLFRENGVRDQPAAGVVRAQRDFGLTVVFGVQDADVEFAVVGLQVHRRQRAAVNDLQPLDPLLRSVSGEKKV